MKIEWATADLELFSAVKKLTYIFCLILNRAEEIYPVCLAKIQGVKKSEIYICGLTSVICGFWRPRRVSLSDRPIEKFKKLFAQDLKTSNRRILMC